MAPTKSNNRKAKAKPLAQRKSSRRKNNATQSTSNDKENETPGLGVNGQEVDSFTAANTNDHEQNWWKINVKKAATLIEKCMKEYGWDRTETTRILKQYREFLVLKKEKSDWNATILYPCWPVDQMWLQHSEMEDFDYDMRNLLGHVIYRVPEIDAAEKARLYASTKDMIKEQFESYDEELWDVIEIRIVDQLGGEEKFEVNSREPLLPIFEQYVGKKEESIHSFRFEFGGKLVEKRDEEKEHTPTPMRLGIKHRGKIEASDVDKVAVTIHHSPGNKEKGYLIDKTTMISKTFDVFAKDELKIERTELVFRFGKKRLYGHESPMVINLASRGNTIDVAALDSLKCTSCICCNPNLNAGEA